MAARWQRIAVDLPKKYNPRERKAIAASIIDHMTERTLKGKDKNNEKFAPYNPKYAKKKGVSVTGVDLVKSFAMLPSMHLISERSGKLLIGFEKGGEQNAKADGNQRGTYGRPSPIPGKAREFLGIKNKEVAKIITSLRSEQKEKARKEAPKEAARQALEGLS